MGNRYEVKLEFTSKKEDIEMILHEMLQVIRPRLFPYIMNFNPTVTIFDEQEDTENETE